MWIVKIEETSGNLYFGPFNSAEEASEWMDAYPCDENVVDMDAFFLNSLVLPNGSLNH
jgi:hypothetical protein